MIQCNPEEDGFLFDIYHTPEHTLWAYSLSAGVLKKNNLINLNILTCMFIVRFLSFLIECQY